MVLLRICLIFYQFQPGVAYKSVACKKACTLKIQQYFRENKKNTQKLAVLLLLKYNLVLYDYAYLKCIILLNILARIKEMSNFIILQKQLRKFTTKISICLIPVDTRRRFHVGAISFHFVRRRIDVEATSCLWRSTEKSCKLICLNDCPINIDQYAQICFIDNLFCLSTEIKVFRIFCYEKAKF